MLIVYGRRQYVRVAYDQSPLTQIVSIDRPAPCLNPRCTRPYDHGCRKVYHTQQYCTIYFCIPLCSTGPPQEIVKCEACGKMWQLDPYLAIVEQRANLAAVVVQEGLELPAAPTGRCLAASSIRGQQQQQQQQQQPQYHHSGQREVLSVMGKNERVPFAYNCVPVNVPHGEEDDDQQPEPVLPVLAAGETAPSPAVGTLT
jgi:hypothetical protein